MKLDNILRIEENGLDLIFGILSDNNICGQMLLITEPKLEEMYGKKVESQLKKINSLKIEYLKDNSSTYAMELAQYAIENDIDIIIGLGGGKILDVCKYASYISKKIFISLPTTLANDGIASPIAVLKCKDGKTKSLGAKMADVIVIDTTLMSNCPLQFIKAGIGDTISNYTALLDWSLAHNKKKDKINDFAYLMSQESLNTLLNTEFTKIDENFIKVLANSIVLSGVAMQLAGSSRPVSGSEHLFSHALDFYTNLNNLHGLQVALGTVSILKILNKDYSKILSYLKKFDVDINPRTLGIDENDFITCMKNASSMRKKRYTCLNEINLNEINLKKIYNELVEEL